MHVLTPIARTCPAGARCLSLGLRCCLNCPTCGEAEHGQGCLNSRAPGHLHILPIRTALSSSDIAMFWVVGIPFWGAWLRSYLKRDEINACRASLIACSI
jgi:hypothetical protein